MDGAQLARFETALNKKDNSLESENAGRIHASLLERGEWGGRSNSQIEKDIRDTLRTHNAEQIAGIDSEYKRTHGQNLSEAIASNPHLSQATKDAAAVYLKGNDRMSTSDSEKLFDIALKEGDIEMFSEAMRDASPSVRQAFLVNRGEERVDSAFGSGADGRHALDLVKLGKIDTATLVSDNTGLIADNEEAIELALNGMTSEERRLYLAGRSLASGEGPAGLSQEEIEHAKQYYDRLHAALVDAGNATETAKWEGLIVTGEGSLIASIAEHKGVFYDSSAEDIAKDVKDMGRSDWESFKKEPDRRHDLERVLRTFLSSEEEAAVMTAFDEKMVAASWEEAKKGSGATDIIALLRRHASDFDSDEEQAVRDIMKAVKEQPDLRKRINAPENEQERAFALDFTEAARSALGSEYDYYVPELLKNGSLSAEKIASLNSGITNDTEMQLLDDLSYLSAVEREELNCDPARRQRVFSFLDESEMQIVTHVLAQGEAHADDKIRLLVDHSGGSSELVRLLENVSPEKLEPLRRDYARKYGSSLEADIMSKLSGQDRVAAMRALTGDRSAEEQYNLARDEHYASRSGFGAWMSDNVWRSGTGAQTDDSMDAFSLSVSQANRVYRELSQEELQQLKGHFQQALDLHKTSKEAAARYSSDAVVAGLAVASVVFAPELTLPLVAKLAAAGATVRVGSKMAFMGTDYDATAGRLGIDATTGAIAAAVSLVGPAQIAAALGVGKAAAANAAQATLVEEGVKQVLAEGSEKALHQGTEAIVRAAMVQGSANLSDDSVKAAVQHLAGRVVSDRLEGEARQNAINFVSARLGENIQHHFADRAKAYLIKEGLNLGGGAAGGSAAEAFQGASQWDGQRSLGQNVGEIGTRTAYGALAGAAGALVVGKGITMSANGYRSLSTRINGGRYSASAPRSPSQFDETSVSPIGEKQLSRSGAAGEAVDDGISAKPPADAVEYRTGKKPAAVPKNDSGKSQWVGARENQEDVVWTSADGQFAVVADGMGGHGAGEVASKIAQVEMEKSYASFPYGATEAETVKWLEQSIYRAHEAVQTAQSAGQYVLPSGVILRGTRDMGSTVVASVRQGDKLHIGWAGDSRAFRLRNGRLEQLTRDHENLDGTLTGALGHHPFTEHVSVDIKPGDRFILASDGLETLSPAAVQEVLSTPGLGAQETAERLVELTRNASAQHQDNVTVSVFDPLVSRQGLFGSARRWARILS